ncbi:MAG: CDP-glucose 4,6-dehydratase [Elusimicrobiaceae bacterium]|nr:CDP-glucose 4,6-dehydratase [Elusimicrobiaceae bacterium]
MWQNTYQGKRVLITGHTGFKGSWLTLWLSSIGAKVCGYSLAPTTTPALFEVAHVKENIIHHEGNILDAKHLNQVFTDFQPEIVFHLAAQPLVRLSYIEPLLTYETNVIGTLNVLEAARRCSSVKAFVNITTDKCYENKEITRGYTENDPMGGYDMYSSSKGCVEILSSSYRRSFLQEAGTFALATARAGNVIGGGDWATDRLIPDCVRNIEAGEKIVIRCPQAIRPWQHVLEPLSGYLLLGHLLYTQGKKYAEGFNLGPQQSSILTVEDVSKLVIAEYGKGSLKIATKDNLHEANLLMLDITKAKKILGWVPTYTAKEAIVKTVLWYKKFYEGKTDMASFTLQQIKEYTASLKWKSN